MKDIVFTLELDDNWANEKANEYLEKGWTLLHVGTKTIDENCYSTVYVVGANQEQYEKYKEELKEPSELEKLIKRVNSELDVY
ncbi:hypothetical protein [Fervidibacillus albus]|uniref:Uncharacterized protein n=1 Tax=Fervidibacillus albus TaxID=2980026 RepID=A0A9E8LW66_9BACI|nr:hypothetical protein [Fervidibacillus albus]WAA10812.1 hypothetical protein OE104_05735 [Fervidibacillus albus]